MLTGGAGNQTKNLKIISNGDENGKGTAVKKQVLYIEASGTKTGSKMA